MRLFLSSENVGNYADRLLALAGNNKKLIYIPNARDDWGQSESAAKTMAHKKQFEDLGFEFTEVNLRDYFGKSAGLAKKLKDVGLVWISGGNTFLLRRAMHDSGLDDLLLKLLQEDKAVYGGSSAGSIVMTPSLHGTERGDDPDQVKNIYGEDIIWNGLGLVGFHLIPHYGSDWFGKEAEQMVAYFKDNNVSYKTLKDGQVIVIDDDKEEFLK